MAYNFRVPDVILLREHEMQNHQIRYIARQRLGESIFALSRVAVLQSERVDPQPDHWCMGFRLLWLDRSVETKESGRIATQCQSSSRASIREFQHVHEKVTLDRSHRRKLSRDFDTFLEQATSCIRIESLCPDTREFILQKSSRLGAGALGDHIRLPKCTDSIGEINETIRRS